jgi:GTP-binding protein LepA
MPVHLVYSQNDIKPTEVGHFAPDYVADPDLHAGQIGYIITGEKSVRDAQIGDTIIGEYSYKKQAGEDAKLKSRAIP